MATKEMQNAVAALDAATKDRDLLARRIERLQHQLSVVDEYVAECQHEVFAAYEKAGLEY